MQANNSQYFRFDDISINTEIELLDLCTKEVKRKLPSFEIIYGINPLVFDMSGENNCDCQRPFPKILNAFSDHTEYYKIDFCEMPELPEDDRIIKASHGLVHVDHRLMNFEAQELSIVTSCSLAKCRLFIPPFNKWNLDTLKVCEKHDLELVKFEDGWKCIEYNDFDKSHGLWYCHHREFTIESFKKCLI
jgi:hypothetical protein